MTAAPDRRALLTAVALAPVLAACGEDSAAQSQGFASGDGVIEQVPVADRSALPPIRATSVPVSSRLQLSPPSVDS